MEAQSPKSHLPFLHLLMVEVTAALRGDGDLRPNCPSELSVKSGNTIVGCRSACDMFQTDQYCCKGQFANSAVCQSTTYSKRFKAACPAAYSYAYDDPSSIFTCTGSDYIVSFCSSRKQTVCTYHNNKLICNGSQNLKPLARHWSGLLLLLASITLWFIF